MYPHSVASRPVLTACRRTQVQSEGLLTNLRSISQILAVLLHRQNDRLCITDRCIFSTPEIRWHWSITRSILLVSACALVLHQNNKLCIIPSRQRRILCYNYVLPSTLGPWAFDLRAHRRTSTPLHLSGHSIVS